MVWSRDQLTVDMSFDFSAAPPAELVRKLQFLLNGLEVNGESLHWRVSVNQAELMQNMDKIAATSFGQRLSDLVQAARFLPPAAAAPRAARPVIHGLD